MNEFRTAYGEKLKVSIGDFEKTRTKQSMQAECDVNNIIKKFQVTGMLEHRNKYEGEYGEFEAIDFHEAMNIVAAAKEMFSSVPSDVRKRFNNDPGEFINFAADKANQEEIYKLGLAERPPQEPAEAPAENGGETGV